MGFLHITPASLAVGTGTVAAIASFCPAALVVTQTRGTSPDAPGMEVVYYRARDNTSATTAVRAQGFLFTASSGVLTYGPDQDQYGGVLVGQTPTAIASRSTPAGTFGFLPAAAYGATVSGGSYVAGSTSFDTQSFRFGLPAFTTTDPLGLIVAAAVVTPGTVVRADGYVSSTSNQADQWFFDLTSDPANPPPDTTLPTIAALDPTPIVVVVAPGQAGSFSLRQFTASDPEAEIRLFTAAVPVPIADNVVVTGGRTDSSGRNVPTASVDLFLSGANFTLADRGTWDIVLTAASGAAPGLTTSQLVRITVIPEPTMVTLAATAGTFAIRRRRGPSPRSSS